jgi:serine/threonine protein kinase
VIQQLGKYQLIRKLATGGMAEVYLAKAAGPMGFEKTLVLKRILPHLAEDPQFVEMFLGEAKLAAQLNHPNIVQIFDFGEADGEYFLAMEYIDGPNLRVLLKKANTAGMTLPPAVCARLIASACEGLAFAHDFQDPTTGEALGLIHRDISPDNILVSRQGAVKVVDFGIAKAAGQSHKTQSGIIKGKLAYMPPEQVRAKALDRRVDVYALGVVFYELLTRHKPFDAPTDASLMQAILFEEKTPASQYLPELPEPLQRILDRALNKDREQRYPDCLALAADLEEFILSVGKRVTTQQIVQLIAQVAPNTESPMPTPQAGTPRSGSGSRPSATPVHTPAPVQAGTGSGTGARSGPRPAHRPNTADMVAPVEPSPEEMPSKTVTLPVDAATTTQQQDSAPSLKKNRLVPALAGVALLAAGGGFVFWQMGSRPTEPVPTTQVVQPTPPDPQTPPPTEKPVAEAHPPEPTPPPSTDPNPPSDTPPVDGSKPPEVAKVEPSNGSPDNSGTPPPPVPEQPQKPGGKRPRPSGSKSTTATVSKGTVVFRVRPYATVILSGRNLGQTPFDPVETPAGRYTVQFINNDLNKKITQAFELKPGETKIIKINLEE